MWVLLFEIFSKIQSEDLLTSDMSLSLIPLKLFVTKKRLMSLMPFKLFVDVVDIIEVVCRKEKIYQQYSKINPFIFLLFSTKNWNTPMIFDMKEGNISLILQAEK